MYVCVSAVFKTNQLYQNTKTQKGKSDKLDLIKVKNICSFKEIQKKKKKANHRLEEIFATYISDKGTLSKVNEEALQLNIRKTTTQFLKSRQKFCIVIPQYLGRSQDTLQTSKFRDAQVPYVKWYNICM